MWKGWVTLKGKEIIRDGKIVFNSNMSMQYDLQVDHNPQLWMYIDINIKNYKVSDITLKSLLEHGK